jgi:hypothetical protein
MGDRNVNPVQRLARQLCKALPAGVVADMTLLRTLAKREVPQTLSAGWRSRLQQEAGDIDRAVALAISNGWLSATGGSFVLTSAGAQFAKRSRVGHRRQRLLHA